MSTWQGCEQVHKHPLMRTHPKRLYTKAQWESDWRRWLYNKQVSLCYNNNIETIRIDTLSFSPLYYQRNITNYKKAFLGKERCIEYLVHTCIYICIYLYKLMSQHKQNKLLNSRNIVVYHVFQGWIQDCEMEGSFAWPCPLLSKNHAHLFDLQPWYAYSSTCKLNSYMCEVCSRCTSAPVLRQ